MIQCVYCGKGLTRANQDFTVDHIIPLSKGGGNGLWNLAPCCFNCNQSKKDDTWTASFDPFVKKA